MHIVFGKAICYYSLYIVSTMYILHVVPWLFKYPQIADASQSSDYLPAFSYLYYFAPYINPSGNNACTFNIKRGKTKLEVIIRPTIRSEVTVEIK